MGKNDVLLASAEDSRLLNLESSHCGGRKNKVLFFHLKIYFQLILTQNT
jgi:hypothetical protein